MGPKPSQEGAPSPSAAATSIITDNFIDHDGEMKLDFEEVSESGGTPKHTLLAPHTHI